MNTFGIAVAAFGTGIPGAATVPGVGFTPAELLAGLGAAVVATLGVLIVRILNTPRAEPTAPTTLERSANDPFKHAA